MGNFNIQALLREAKDRKWDDRTLAQKSADLAEALRDESVRKLNSNERALLSALSRLAADENNRRFLYTLCNSVLKGSSEEQQCSTLKKLLADFGGVPTFFSTMSRLRFKAAARFGGLGEVRNIFRSTFGEIALPTQMDKVDKRVREFAKDKLTLALAPLSPVVFGTKSAMQYMHHLEAILARQTGVGLSINPQRLCPELSPYAPTTGAKTLAEKLTALIGQSISGGLRTPLVVQTGTSDILPIVVDAFMQAMNSPAFKAANVILELPAYLNNAPAVLRELTEWAEKRISKGSEPLRVLIVKGSHLDKERVCEFTYGAENAAAPTKAVTDTRFKHLVHTAISADPKAICPVIGTHNPFDICYALLDWGRSGRVGLPHFVFRAGLGNHMGRILAKEGATVVLTAGLESEKAETGGFEEYLKSLIDELARPDGYLTHGYAPESDSMGWTRMRQQFLASLSGREETQTEQEKSIDGFIHGTLHRISERAYSAAFYAAADEERDRKQSPLPLIIGGKEVDTPLTCIRRSLTAPGIEDYRYTGADFKAVDDVLRLAAKAEAETSVPSEDERRTCILKMARAIDKHRTELGALLVRDAGFNFRDAENEILCAIDACYYDEICAEHDGLKDGTQPQPLGTIVVAPGRVHPLAEAVSGIAAAYVTGNTIIYKPSADTVLLGKKITEIMEEVGLQYPRLQFIPCPENQIAVKLMTDSRISGVITNGYTWSAQQLAEKAPTAAICNQPAGATTAYLAASGNWQQLIRDITQAVYFRSGQSPTCPHTLLVQAEVYDNQLFINSLKDALSLLQAAPGWREEAMLGPLAGRLNEEEYLHLTQNGPQETWLVKPSTNELGSIIWSPGIKTGVTIDSPLLQYIHKLPILALIRVESPARAMTYQRNISAGQAAIIYSQNDEEIATWKQELAECTNLCINCCPTMRPAIAPFGSWSPNLMGEHPVPGGRNFLISLNKWVENARPQRRGKQRNIAFTPWEVLFPKPNPDETMRLTTAADSISYWWENEYGIEHVLSPDPATITTLRYLPRAICLRAEEDTSDIDLSIAIMAALKAGCDIRLSTATLRQWMTRSLEGLGIIIIPESRMDFLKRLPTMAAEGIPVRDTAATDEDMAVAAACGLQINRAPVVGNGRIELLHCLREQYTTVKR